MCEGEWPTADAVALVSEDTQSVEAPEREEQPL